MKILPLHSSIRHSLFLTILCAHSVSVHAEPPKAHELTIHYSFEEYIKDFNKPYDIQNDPALYQTKKEIFESNLNLVVEHNSNVVYDIKTGQRKKLMKNGGGSGHTYHMGVNHFMDFTQEEMHAMNFGYDKSTILTKGRPHNLSLTSNFQKHHKMDLPFNITNVSTLPTSVRYNQTTPIKNQGACGSCWSFSSIAALESHIAIQTGRLDILSTQELVSCVSNPQECGGTGGCEGATAELAYDYVADYGIVKEESFPYKASDGPICPLRTTTTTTSTSTSTSTSTTTSGSSTFESDWMKMISTTTSRRNLRGNKYLSKNSTSPVIAKIQGYANIPSNDYKALMNTIAKHGPAVVALAASSWSFYAGGVYSPEETTRPIDWDLNHGVVVEGYGTDEITGEDYWLVRNSWGEMWGENGYIRLKRVDIDDDSEYEEEGLCGYDLTPLDGIGCALNPDGSEIVQHSVKVCGTNGLLFDPVIPIGGYLV